MQVTGWAIIRETYTADEVWNSRLPEIVDDIASRIDDTDTNIRVQLDYMNAIPTLRVALQKNHYTPATDVVIELFERIAAVAPGSYGVLHIYDWEGQFGDPNDIHVLVLARGRLRRSRDPFLSPVVPRIEDADPEDDHQPLFSSRLPLGSVVRLTDGTQKLMVIGRRQRDTAGERVFDFAGVPYPQGNLGPGSTFLFDHDAIAEVFYLGYSNDDDVAWLDTLHGLDQPTDTNAPSSP